MNLFKLLFDHRGLDYIQIRNLRILAFGVLFTTLSGAIRKWGVSSNLIGNLFLLGQIILPIGFFFLFKPKIIRTNSKILLFSYLIILIILAFNPLNQTLFHGLLGIILHLSIWLLIFVYFDNSNRFPVERLLPLIFGLLLFQTFLGFIQYQLPASHFLNKYSSEGARSIAKVGTAIRVTGTFSYLSGYTAFLMAAGMSMVAIFKIDASRKVKYSTMIALLVASMFSGSRATFSISVIICLFVGFLELKKTNPVKGLLNIFVLGSILLLFATQFSFVQRAFSNLMLRFEGGLEQNEYETRTVGTLQEVWNFKGRFALTGIGLGATYQGANAIWGESKYAKQYPGGYEEELERIVIEGGYLLFFFKLILLAVLFFRSRIPKIFMLGIILIQLITFPLVFNVYNAFFFFIGISLVDRAYRITDPRKALSFS